MKGFAVVAIAAVCILETSGCASEHYATHPRGSPQDLLAIMTKEDVIAPADSGVPIQLFMPSTSPATSGRGRGVHIVRKDLFCRNDSLARQFRNNQTGDFISDSLS